MTRQAGRTRAPDHDARPRRLPSGTWTCQVQLGGTRYTVSAPSSAETQAKRDALKSEWRRGQLAPKVLPKDAHTGPGLTVERHLRSWLTGRQNSALAPITWRRHAVEIEKRLIPALGRVRLAELTRAQVRAALDGFRQGGASARTVRFAREALRLACQVAVDDGVLADNPAARITLPTQRRAPARALSPDDVQALLATAQGKQLPRRPPHTLTDRVTTGAAHHAREGSAGDALPRQRTPPRADNVTSGAASPWYPLWLTALCTGCRAGELLGLPWSAVDWQAGAIQVCQVLAVDAQGDYQPRPYPKRPASVRRIDVPPEVLDALALVRDHQNEAQRQSGLVFVSRVGTPWHHNNVARAFKADCARAGVVLRPRECLHLLRHSYASTLLAAGRPIPEVAYLLGHSPGMLMQTYAHFVVAPTTRAADAVRSRYALSVQFG